MLVERLVDAGYLVVPVNPDLVARRRWPARKKDDAEHARIACHIALDRFERLRPLVPHGEETAELRAIARDDERASRDGRRYRLLNRLRADLIATFPAARAIAGDDLGRPSSLHLLERWPTGKRCGYVPTSARAPSVLTGPVGASCLPGWSYTRVIRSPRYLHVGPACWLRKSCIVLVRTRCVPCWRNRDLAALSEIAEKRIAPQFLK